MNKNPMSEYSCYEQLGLKEDASFEEIQDARDRLMEEHSGDPKRVESIEAAYDEILMLRLKQRQEGKIKVPEGIRFPEKTTTIPTKIPTPPTQEAPAWLQNLLDTPSQPDILWPGGIFLGLSALTLFQPSSAPLALAVGVGFSLYFLNRKENKFGRAVTIAVISLTLGLVLGTPLGNLLHGSMGVLLSPDAIAAGFTFFAMWLATSFLR
nr:CPP1-like family protein [Oxynema aestuarii]